MSEPVPRPRWRPLGGRSASLLATAAVASLLVPGATGVAQVFRLSDYSGEEVFVRFCASCHGSSGRGNGPVAMTLNVAVPDLTTLSERHGNRFPAGDVREIIDGRSVVVAHGPRVMPVWGYEFWVEEGADRVAEGEARDLIDRLVDYIEAIQVLTPDAGVPR